YDNPGAAWLIDNGTVLRTDYLVSLRNSLNIELVLAAGHQLRCYGKLIVTRMSHLRCCGMFVVNIKQKALHRIFGNDTAIQLEHSLNMFTVHGIQEFDAVPVRLAVHFKVP